MRCHFYEENVNCVESHSPHCTGFARLQKWTVLRSRSRKGRLHFLQPLFCEKISRWSEANSPPKKWQVNPIRLKCGNSTDFARKPWMDTCAAPCLGFPWSLAKFSRSGNIGKDPLSRRGNQEEAVPPGLICQVCLLLLRSHSSRIDLSLYSQGSRRKCPPTGCTRLTFP